MMHKILYKPLFLMQLCCAIMLACCSTKAQAGIEVRSTEVDDTPLWFAEDNAVPVVHIILTFEGAGSSSDSDALSGRAGLVASMLDEGAGQMNSLAFQRALESNAIEFSAGAQKDDLVVSIHSLKEQLPTAVTLATLALSKPRFDADAFERVRNDKLASLKRAMSQPSYLASRAFAKSLYGTHPYGREPFGTQQTLNAITTEDLSAYRARYMTRANLQIAAAGAISKSELKEALEPLVEALPEAFFPERDLPGASLDGKGNIIRIAHASPQSVVMFGGMGIARKDKDFYAAYMMNEALGSGALTSRLMQEVRRKKGLAYSIGTALDAGVAADGFIGQFSTKNSTVDESIAAVKGSVADLAAHGLGERECRDLRQEIINGFALKLDSTEHIAQMIATMMRFDLGVDYLEKRTAFFENVTCDEVKQSAERLLDPKHWLWVVVGGDSSIASPEPTIVSDGLKDSGR